MNFFDLNRRPQKIKVKGTDFEFDPTFINRIGKRTGKLLLKSPSKIRKSEISRASNYLGIFESSPKFEHSSRFPSVLTFTTDWGESEFLNSNYGKNNISIEKVKEKNIPMDENNLINIRELNETIGNDKESIRKSISSRMWGKMDSSFFNSVGNKPETIVLEDFDNMECSEIKEKMEHFYSNQKDFNEVVAGLLTEGKHYFLFLEEKKIIDFGNKEDEGLSKEERKKKRDEEFEKLTLTYIEKLQEHIKNTKDEKEKNENIEFLNSLLKIKESEEIENLNQNIEKENQKKLYFEKRVKNDEMLIEYPIEQINEFSQKSLDDNEFFNTNNCDKNNNLNNVEKERKNENNDNINFKNNFNNNNTNNNTIGINRNDNFIIPLPNNNPNNKKPCKVIDLFENDSESYISEVDQIESNNNMFININSKSDLESDSESFESSSNEDSLVIDEPDENDMIIEENNSKDEKNIQNYSENILNDYIKQKENNKKNNSKKKVTFNFDEKNKEKNLISEEKIIGIEKKNENDIEEKKIINDEKINSIEKKFENNMEEEKIILNNNKNKGKKGKKGKKGRKKKEEKKEKNSKKDKNDKKEKKDNNNKNLYKTFNENNNKQSENLDLKIENSKEIKNEIGLENSDKFVNNENNIKKINKNNNIERDNSYIEDNNIDYLEEEIYYCEEKEIEIRRKDSEKKISEEKNIEIIEKKDNQINKKRKSKSQTKYFEKNENSSEFFNDFDRNNCFEFKNRIHSDFDKGFVLNKENKKKFKKTKSLSPKIKKKILSRDLKWCLQELKYISKNNNIQNNENSDKNNDERNDKDSLDLQENSNRYPTRIRKNVDKSNYPINIMLKKENNSKNIKMSKKNKDRNFIKNKRKDSSSEEKTIVNQNNDNNNNINLNSSSDNSLEKDRNNKKNLHKKKNKKVNNEKKDKIERNLPEIKDNNKDYFYDIDKNNDDIFQFSLVIPAKSKKPFENNVACGPINKKLIAEVEDNEFTLSINNKFVVLENQSYNIENRSKNIEAKLIGIVYKNIK